MQGYNTPFTRSCNRADAFGLARTAWIVALFCTGLAACGGGNGGGSSSRIPAGVVPEQKIEFVNPAPSDPDPLIPEKQIEVSITPTEPDRIFRPDSEVETQTSDSTLFSLYHLEQNALIGINAPIARSRIQTSSESDVKVGVLDFGVHTDHPAFNDITIREVYSHSVFNQTGVTFSHGTAVASLVAMTAPRAEIISIAVDEPSSDNAVSSRYTYDHYTPDELSYFDGRWEKHIEIALDEEVDILNVSIGFDGIVSDYVEESVKQSLRREFGAAIDAMAQADTAEAERAVLVWAAGNANGAKCKGVAVPSCENRGTGLISNYKIVADHAEVLPGLAALFPAELQDHFMAVVAVGTPVGDSPAPIANFANRCGMTADYCIAAPGVDITFVYYGDEDWEYAYDDGSSYAAPLVAGGLALVMERFSYTAKEARRRLLVTANSTGIYEPDEGSDTSAVYGHGLLDLDAATRQPVGASSIVLGQYASDSGVSLSRTRLSLGPAFGATSVRSLAGRKVAAFDTLAAPFWHDIGNFVGVRKPSLSGQLQRLLNSEQLTFNRMSTPWQTVVLPGNAKLGLSRDESGYQGLGGPSLVLAWANPDSSLAYSAFTTEGMDQQPPMTGTSIDWKPFGLSAGVLAERTSALGAEAEGGFGHLSTNTLFARLRRSAHTGHWLLDAEAEIGYSKPHTSHGLLASMRPMASSRYALSASRATGHNEGGRIKLSLEQPLRAERAQTTLRVPIGRTKAGEVVLDSWETDMEPTGRQIDLSAWWYNPDSRYGVLRLGTVYSRHPGHDADATPSLALLAGYRLAF